MQIERSFATIGKKGVVPVAKICITEKTAQRQRWIENGLLELIQKHKYDEITVSDLCRHLKLSRRSFYRYFSDMDDVMDTLMHHTFQDLAVPGKMLGITELKQNFDFWLQRKDLLQALSNSGMSSKIMEYTIKYTVSPNWDSDPSMNTPDDISLFVIGGLTSIMIAWHNSGFRKSSEEMARIAYRILTEPVLKIE